MFSRSKKDDVPPRRQGASAGDARREKAVHTQEQHDVDTTLFRRNRTLTGSLSSRVRSANEHKADLQSPRIQAHHLVRQRRKIGSILVITCSMCVVLAGLLLQLTAHPVVSAHDGSIAIKKPRYEKVIDDYLSRHPVERLRFVLNRDRLNDYVRTQLPEVTSVEADGSAGFGAGSFIVSMRHPLASWMIGNDQYYVDSSGVPFQLNYYETPSVHIVDESGLEQTSGTAIASSRFLNFVGRAVSLSKDYGLEVEQAIIPRATTRQVELRVKGRDYPVRLSLDRSVGEQIEDMQRSIAYFDKNQKKLAYIDVRVPGKAFYKEK